MNLSIRITSRMVLLTTIVALAAVGCKKKPPEEPPRVVEAPPMPPVPPPPPPPPPPPAKVTESLARINFDFDRSNIRDDQKGTLDANAALLAKYSSARIEVQGHCDERGTTEYNLALGQRRAAAAKKYLLSKGVSANRVTTVSYGEERPLATGSDEYAWGQNRRAEFVVSSGGDDTLVGSTGK